MGPIGHVVQIVAAAVGIVGLVLGEQIAERRRRIRIARPVDRTRRRCAITPIAMLPMVSMRIVLECRRNILVLGRFAVCKHNHKRSTTGHDLGTRGPRRRVVLSKKIRIAAAGIRDVSCRTRFRADQCRDFTRSNRSSAVRGKVDAVRNPPRERDRIDITGCEGGLDLRHIASRFIQGFTERSPRRGV